VAFTCVSLTTRACQANGQDRGLPGRPIAQAEKQVTGERWQGYAGGKQKQTKNPPDSGTAQKCPGGAHTCAQPQEKSCNNLLSDYSRYFAGWKSLSQKPPVTLRLMRFFGNPEIWSWS
jgi:hypothetical protein